MIDPKHPLAPALHELERAFERASSNAAVAASENRPEAQEKLQQAAAYHRGMMCLKYLSEHENDYCTAVGHYIEQPA